VRGHRENDFVGEYKGEIITKEEAERRGAVYEIQKLSYLFSLNATQEIDGTNFGNTMRFINHAKGKANLYPRIIMCQHSTPHCVVCEL
jgi:histone-lysine N-methyltransferase EZH2